MLMKNCMLMTCQKLFRFKLNDNMIKSCSFVILNVLLTAGLFAVSCQSDAYYKYDVENIDMNRSEDTIKVSADFYCEVPGANEVYLYDTLLMFTTNDPSGMLKVYSLNSNKQIASLCFQGRANNEFITIPYNRSSQFYLRDSDLIMPLVDYDLLKELNLSESLKRKSTVINSTSGCLSIQDGSFVLLDDYVNKRFEFHEGVVTDYENHKCEIPHFYITERDDSKEIPVYSKLMEYSEERYASGFYSGVVYKKEDRNLIVQPLHYSGYILLFDLDNKKYHAVHDISSLAFEDEVPSSPKNFISDIALTTDFFIALYFPQGDTSNKRLLFFDWDCHLLKGISLDISVQAIAYDNKNKRIIGLDRTNGMVYSFDISETINSLDIK